LGTEIGPEIAPELGTFDVRHSGRPDSAQFCEHGLLDMELGRTGLARLDEGARF
jgi:hypothetical protein